MPSFALSLGPYSLGGLSPLFSPTPQPRTAAPERTVPSFADTLSGALGTVNQAMKAEDDAVDSLAQGRAENLHSVQIASVRSDVLMRLTQTAAAKVAQATTTLMQIPL